MPQPRGLLIVTWPVNGKYIQPWSAPPVVNGCKLELELPNAKPNDAVKNIPSYARLVNQTEPGHQANGSHGGGVRGVGFRCGCWNPGGRRIT